MSDVIGTSQCRDVPMYLPHILNVMGKINPAKPSNSLQGTYMGLRYVCSTDLDLTTTNSPSTWGESVRQGHDVCSCNQSWPTFLLNESLTSIIPSQLHYSHFRKSWKWFQKKIVESMQSKKSGICESCFIMVVKPGSTDCQHRRYQTGISKRTACHITT